MVFNMEMQVEIETCTSEVKKTNDEIQVASTRNKQKGSKKIRDRLMKQYRAELKYRFDQWHCSIILRNKKAIKLDKTVCKKMNIFLYR